MSPSQESQLSTLECIPCREATASQTLGGCHLHPQDYWRSPGSCVNKLQRSPTFTSLAWFLVLLKMHKPVLLSHQHTPKCPPLSHVKPKPFESMDSTWCCCGQPPLPKGNPIPNAVGVPVHAVHTHAFIYGFLLWTWLPFNNGFLPIPLCQPSPLSAAVSIYKTRSFPGK